MFDNWGIDLGALDALKQLEQNTPEALLRQRSSERMEIRVGVVIHYGDSSRREDLELRALTGDISNGGCLVLAPRPLLAGDLFWLSFPKDEIAIGSLLARCMRCRLVREDTFEIGFRFLENIDLIAAVQNQNRT